MEDKKLKYMPNQQRHQIVSFIKSGIRVIGYILLCVNIPLAVAVLVISEAVGIIEEMV